MTAVIPERTLEQRAKALRKANEIRVLRAHMKQALTLNITLELLDLPPWWLKSMKVEALLRAMPHWGPSKAERVLRRLAIGGTKTVGGLSVRQRRVLITELRATA